MKLFFKIQDKREGRGGEEIESKEGNEGKEWRATWRGEKTEVTIHMEELKIAGRSVKRRGGEEKRGEEGEDGDKHEPQRCTEKET